MRFADGAVLTGYAARDPGAGTRVPLEPASGSARGVAAELSPFARGTASTMSSLAFVVPGQGSQAVGM